jgi:hypothetical protein
MEKETRDIQLTAYVATSYDKARPDLHNCGNSFLAL